MSQYQLRTDNLGRRRLHLQGLIYNPGSYQFLLAQGIKKNQSVLEVGCGSGSMTPWLAQQVGKKGRLLAIDNSPNQVLATSKLVKKLKQVECRELSVFDADQLNEQFDIIYVRFVLIHLTDPITALKKLAPSLKKNGRIIIDEILNFCNFCHPENDTFTKRRHFIGQFFIRNGLNPNFGLTLKTALEKLKLTDIQESLFQPILKDNQRKLLSLFFKENKDKFISLGIITNSEWEKFITELEKLEQDKKYFIALSSLYQISAKKS